MIFSYAESVGAKHFETSAKNNIGVEELFLELTNLVESGTISNCISLFLLTFLIIYR